MLFTLGLLEANCCLLQLPHHKNDDGELGGLEYRGLLGSVQLWNFFDDESRLVKILGQKPTYSNEIIVPP